MYYEFSTRTQVERVFVFLPKNFPHITFYDLWANLSKKCSQHQFVSRICIQVVNLMLWIKSTELKKGASDCYKRQSNFQDEHDQCACAWTFLNS